MVLSRVTGKVFAGEAPADEIGVFGSAKNNDATLNSDVATIQNYPNNAYSLGWGSGIVSSDNYPPMEEVNGVLKTISYQACYLLQEGIPAYDIGTEYSATSLVKNWSGTTLEIYKSLVDGNIGNPLTDATKWIRAEVISNTPRIDGQWIINVQQQVVNNLNLYNSNNTPYPVDLSGYLPNDGYDYEVIIDGNMETGSTSGRYCAFIVQSAYGYGIYLGNGRPRTNATVTSASNATIVVGTDRKLYIARANNYYGTATLDLKGYRRIGTNA
jgi:hypothetical protein